MFLLGRFRSYTISWCHPFMHYAMYGFYEIKVQTLTLGRKKKLCRHMKLKCSFLVCGPENNILRGKKLNWVKFRLQIMEIYKLKRKKKFAIICYSKSRDNVKKIINCYSILIVHCYILISTCIMIIILRKLKTKNVE